jgi:hypothetical protein
MEQNVGGYDRVARLILGPILSFTGKATLLGLLPLSVPLGALAVAAGFVLLVSGATGRCMLHSVFGVDTTTG